MNLYQKRIFFVVSLNCSYGGNIIPSLVILASILEIKYNATISWILPTQEEREWIQKIQKKYKIYFIDPKQNVTTQLIKIFTSNPPDLIHSHYGTFDQATVYATKKLKLKTKIVWHIHSWIGYDFENNNLKLLRKIKRTYSYHKHYGIVGKKVHLIPVSEEVAAFSNYCRTHIIPFPPLKRITIESLPTLQHSTNSTTIINGIDFTRLHLPNDKKYPKTFTFFSFGGIETIKKIEYIIQAGIILRNKGIQNFKVLITNGIGTRNMLNRFFGDYNNSLPEWIELEEQSENISCFFSKASCYISSSIKETMATALAEASYFEIPIIQSDIWGTYWNANNPSVLLFRNKDIHDLADKMEYMLNNYEHFKQACSITKDNNLKRLSISNWCNKIIEVYNKL